MSQLPALTHPILFGFLARVFHQQNNSDEHRWNRPPQTKTQLPHELRNSNALPEPREKPPDVRCAGESKCPGNRARSPKRPSLWLTFAQFLGAQAHAELCAAGEPPREWDCGRVHRLKSLIRLARQFDAANAILQMRGEPFALGLRNAFDALLRDQLFGAGVQFRGHAGPLSSALRSASRPR